jgi:glycerophosphoryl diester phosphodiesterase
MVRQRLERQRIDAESRPAQLVSAVRTGSRARGNTFCGRAEDARSPKPVARRETRCKGKGPIHVIHRWPLMMVLGCLWVVTAHSGICSEFQNPSKRVLVIGHRGAAGLAPENTLTAFKRALESGVDAIELDVLLTADHHVVVHHDFELEPDLTRTGGGRWIGEGGSRTIRSLSLEELKQYDVGRVKPGSRLARRYPDQVPSDGERVPALAEVFGLLKSGGHRNCQVWIEIKTSPEKPLKTPAPEVVVASVLSTISANDMTGRTFVLSFDWRALKHVQRMAPQVPTVYLSLEGVRLNNIKAGRPGASPWMAGLDIDDYQGSVPRAVAAAGGRHWAAYYKHLTFEDIQTAHRSGLKVYAWTVDSKNEMQRLVDMGVDGIITNRPDRLQAVLKARQ